MGKPKTFLGIGASDHDYTAALVREGEPIMVVEDERVTRVKYGLDKWYTLPGSHSSEYCLNRNGLSWADIDLVCTNAHVERRVFDHGFGGVRTKVISHHLAHAASTFYTSPFEEAAIVVMDGAGSRTPETTSQTLHLEVETIARGSGGEIEVIERRTGTRHATTCYWKYMAANSIGSIYQTITEALGLGAFDNGKTMGLAAYGDRSLVTEMSDYVRIATDGSVSLDPYALLEWAVSLQQKVGNAFQIRANIAAAAQALFEEAVVRTFNHAKRLTGLNSVCYAGGNALNSVANYRLLGESGFDHLHVYPAPGDNGTALGAALYCAHHVFGFRRIPNNVREIGRIAYAGPEYSENEILEALWGEDVHFRKPERLIEEVSQKLNVGMVVGWHQGRSETGPRALGNRSILAIPADPRMREHVNAVKGRESYRPVAPVVVEEAASDYFGLSIPAPFMLLVAPATKKARLTIPAAVHVDGTARLQTVNSETNPLLHALLREVGRLTGHPVLINTSFNLKGEAIVETPEDAVATFCRSDLDLLVLGDYLVEKHSNWAAPSNVRG